MSVSPAFKAQIENHLNELAAKDELFAVTLKKENKNIDDCITYILNQVQQSGKMGFADDEIYGMAVHYYDEDDIQVGKKVSAKVVVNHSIDAPKPKKEAKHICPLQLDIIERLIERFTMKGDVINDPFGGLFSTAYKALEMGRGAISSELKPEYYDDGLFYLKSIEYKINVPTLFDLVEL